MLLLCVRPTEYRWLGPYCSVAYTLRGCANTVILPTIFGDQLLGAGLALVCASLRGRADSCLVEQSRL